MEQRGLAPTPQQVGLSRLEAEALIHRGLVTRVTGWGLVLTGAGYERLLMAQQGENL